MFKRFEYSISFKIIHSNGTLNGGITFFTVFSKCIFPALQSFSLVSFSHVISESESSTGASLLWNFLPQSSAALTLLSHDSER